MSVPTGNPAPVGGRNKTLIIVGIVVAVLLCCAAASVAIVTGGILAFNSTESTRSETVKVDPLEAELEDFEDDGFFDDEAFLREPSDEDIWYEAERAVEFFHPSFHLAAMGLAEEYDDIQRFSLVAESDQTPGFMIAFMSLRQNTSGDAGMGEYTDAESGMLWLHETWAAGGMAAFAGSSPLVNDSMRAGIEASFVGAHEGWIVTDFDLNSNVSIGLSGIHDDDLGLWYGDSVSFESAWDNDLQAGVWRETSFDDRR